jgi:hypothetical protein
MQASKLRAVSRSRLPLTLEADGRTPVLNAPEGVARCAQPHAGVSLKRLHGGTPYGGAQHNAGVKANEPLEGELMTHDVVQVRLHGGADVR